jgi:hypothetical protein
MRPPASRRANGRHQPAGKCGRKEESGEVVYRFGCARVNRKLQARSEAFALDNAAGFCFNRYLDCEHRKLRIATVRKSLHKIRPIVIAGARGARRVIVAVTGD